MSFWSDFSAALSTALTEAKTEVESAVKYFTPMVEAGAAEVATAALNAALQQAPLLITGQEKLSNATATVVSTLATTGKAVAVNIAESAVQSAVNALASAAPPKSAS